MKRRKQASNSRAFTLVEAMAALMVLTMVALGLATALPAASRSAFRARHRDIAAAAARSELEYWRSVGYLRIHALLGERQENVSQFVAALPDLLPGPVSETRIYRVTQDLSTPPQTPEDTGQVRVTAILRWKETWGATTECVLTTVIADNSLEDPALAGDDDTSYEDDPDDPDTADDRAAGAAEIEPNDEDLGAALPLPPPLPVRP